ncbi:MAG: hypothetical protein WKG00_02720 [Polyangiaceae bacterium]
MARRASASSGARARLLGGATRLGQALAGEVGVPRAGHGQAGEHGRRTPRPHQRALEEVQGALQVVWPEAAVLVKPAQEELQRHRVDERHILGGERRLLDEDGAVARVPHAQVGGSVLDMGVPGSGRGLLRGRALQGVQQLRRCLEAVLPAPSQAGHDHPRQRRRDVGPAIPRVRGGLDQPHRGHRQLRRPLPGSLPGAGLEEQRAQRVDIGTTVELARAAHLLRGHVGRRAQRVATLAARRQCHRSGDAEVGDQHPATAGQQDVRRREVAVHDARLVGRNQRLGHGDAQLAAAQGGQRPALRQLLGQRRAVHQLHGQEPLALVPSDVEGARHPRVRDASRQLDLVADALQRIRPGQQLAVDDRPRHHLVELEIAHAQHRAHAAGAKHAQHLVASSDQLVRQAARAEATRRRERAHRGGLARRVLAGGRAGGAAVVLSVRLGARHAWWAARAAKAQRSMLPLARRQAPW